MLALKYLLITCGLGMMLRGRLHSHLRPVSRNGAPAHAGNAGRGGERGTDGSALADFAGAGDAGMGTAAAGLQHCGRAQWYGGSPSEPDERNRAGDALSGAHLVTPLVEDVALFDTRDQIFTTGVSEDGKTAAANTSAKMQLLDVQAKEGLTLGLAITVRYRLDAKRLDYIQGNLPRPVEKEIVPPTVASVWREIVPNYTVREVFSAKREEVRQRVAGMITQKLAADGIVVKEVMLRDIQLPPEYAKGLEELLLKEQENDRMGVETELKGKEVRIAELEAEATKVQQIKQAEGRSAGARAAGQGRGGCDAIHAAVKGEADRAEPTGGAGAQGGDHSECGSRGASEADR